MAENKVRVVFEAFMDKFQRDVKAAAKATLEIGDAGVDASNKVNFDKSNESVNNLEKNLNRLKGAIKTVAIGYIGKKMFDATKENFKDAMAFQEEMAETFTLLPELSGQAREAMTNDVKQFAKDMKVLPENITPALYQAISASIPEDEVFGFLESSQKAARGGKADLETSVDVLSSILNAYGSDVISVTEASDLMFTAVKKGKTTFGEMASNMYSVLPIARSLDLPFKNVTASISTMTAMGTQTAQATTQIGRFLAEISRQGTKSSDIFEAVTGKTFKAFIAEGYNIQDVLNVMEAAAKKLNVEVKDLFSSDEAGRAASTLSAGASKFTEDLQAMENSTGSTEKAFNEMNGTIAATTEGIKAKISVFKIGIADKYFPQIEEAINNVDESFDRLDGNGSLDRLAGSIGNMVSTVITQFDNILNNIDGIIEKIDGLTNFISNNLPGAITVVKGLAGAFLAVKMGMLINDGIILFQGAIKLLSPAIGILTTGLYGASAAQTTLNTAMALNPIGILIILIGLIVIAVLNLSKEYMSFNDFLLVSFEMIKIAFYSLLWVLVKGFDMIIWGLDKLIGWIPGIGEALEKVADVSGKALDGLSSSIDDSIKKIDELNNKEIKDKIPKPGTPGGGMTPEEEDLSLAQHAAKAGKNNKEKDGHVGPKGEEIIVPNNLEDLLKSNKGKKKKKKTIHDRIREVQDKTNPDIDLYESRSDLAKVKDDDKGVKQNKSLIIETLRKQAGDMLNLQLSSKGQDVKIVEAARNKLLVKIEETLKDINDGVSKMIGDFNTPSDLRVLTEYQYKVDKSDNNLSKRFVYSPEVSMYLTIADTGEKGIAQTKSEVEHFTGAVFANDKNDLVTKFMQDVTRN